MKNSHQNHIPQTTGWSNQVRDFGKFWEVLGRGSGYQIPQTTHKACNHGGTPNKTLKISQDLSKIPTCAANSTPASRSRYQIPQTTRKDCNHGGTPNKTLKNSHLCRQLNARTPQWVSHTADHRMEQPSERFWEILGGFGYGV